MTNTKVTKASDIKREWYLIDLEGKILGRAASRIAQLLIGKSKPYFVRNLDCGDYVVVINSQKVEVTGKKKDQKLYSRFSGYPNGLKQKKFSQVIESDPAYVIREAVSGMLPQNKLRDSMMLRLYIYKDGNHPYANKRDLHVINQ